MRPSSPGLSLGKAGKREKKLLKNTSSLIAAESNRPREGISLKNKGFFLGQIIFIFLILMYPSAASALKFLTGKGGFISPTGPVPVPGSCILFLGAAQVLPSGPQDIIVGMGVFPLINVLRVGIEGNGCA